MKSDESPEGRAARKAAEAYQTIAPEYYDATRHPTCANFRQASALALSPWLRRQCGPAARVCEAGAGKSLVQEFIRDNATLPAHLLVTDASPAMLDYSRKGLATVKDDAEFAVAFADALPAGAREFTVVVASLGDPYNDTEFWREANRVLESCGQVLFTTPSHEWAAAFRRDCDPNAAEFALADGSRVQAPSLIYDVDEQINMMRAAGFSTLAVREVALDDLETARPSHKLTLPQLRVAPIVRGYLVRKSS